MVVGRRRRAADAIVGREAEEESALRVKRESRSGEGERFWGGEIGCQTVASEFGGVAVGRARDFENRAGFGLRQRCCEVSAAFPAAVALALGQLSRLAGRVARGRVSCWR